MALAATLVEPDSFRVASDDDDVRARAVDITYATMCYASVLDRAAALSGIPMRVTRKTMRAFAERHGATGMCVRALHGFRAYPALQLDLDVPPRYAGASLDARDVLAIDVHRLRTLQRDGDAPLVSLFYLDVPPSPAARYALDAASGLVPLAMEAMYEPSACSATRLTPIGTAARGAAKRKQSGGRPSSSMAALAATYLGAPPAQRAPKTAARRRAAMNEPEPEPEPDGESLGSEDTEEEDDDDDDDESFEDEGGSSSSSSSSSSSDDEDDDDDDDTSSSSSSEDAVVVDDSSDDDVSQPGPVYDNRLLVRRMVHFNDLQTANPVPAFDGHVVLEPREHKYFVDGAPGYRSTTEQIHKFFNEFNAAAQSVQTVRGTNWHDKPYYAPVMAAVTAAWRDAGIDVTTGAAHALLTQASTYYALAKCDDEETRAVLRIFDETAPRAAVAEWEANGAAASAAGTDLHECIEFFYRGVYTRADLERLAATTRPVVAQFLAFHDAEIAGKYEPYRMELLAFDPEVRTCGAMDGLFRNVHTGNLKMFDWKCSREIKREAYKGATGHGPFADVPDCNYWHYTIQQNVYRYYLRRYASLELKDGMALAIFHPTHDAYEVIEMMVRDDLVDAWRASLLAEKDA